MQNRQIVLVKRPVGMVDETTTSMVVVDRTVCGPMRR
jgi:hypothetical protein